LISVRRIDPARDPDGASTLAREAGTADALIDRGGAVLVRQGARRHVVLLADLADYGRDSTSAPTVTRLRAEEGLTAAAAEVGDGYGDAPSVRGFADWRPTVWQRARPVITAPIVGVVQVALVSASPRSWATRDVANAAALTTPTDPDLLGPVKLAVRAQGKGG